MDPATAAFIASFLKVGEIADGVNDFYELVKNSAEGRDVLSGMLNRRVSASGFERLFERLESGRTTSQQRVSGDSSVYQAGVRLVFSIYYKYWQHPDFTQIPVLAGRVGEKRLS